MFSRRTQISILFLLMLVLPSNVLAVDRGINIVGDGSQSKQRGMGEVYILDKAGNEVGLFKESHALVIGVSRYEYGWPQLPGVLNDIRMVREALEKHGFNVVVVEDPDKKQLEDAIHQFIHMYGQRQSTRLVFYFAGHGHTLQLAYGGDMGYIVPRDAPNPNDDKPGFLERAIDMQQFEVYAKRIQAKHALFLFDSCFSGSIFSTSRAVPEHISYKTSLPVRQFITAGSANETVPDESVFRAQFIVALEGAGDVDHDGYLTGVELGEFLQKTVTNYTKGYQHPQYGKIRDRNLDKGDFVFPVNLASLPPTAGKVTPEKADIPRAPAPIVLRGHLQINVNVSKSRV
ncbi:MAG: caspase family protein, partial [Nitrospinae bacterium]|nr:caspase family protein [Nitrospinota bacterium]